MTLDRLENICIAIPAFNASDTIGAVVCGGLKYVRTVIVADDGSTDGTGETAKKAGAQVLTIPSNCGKGNALRVLFREAIRQNFRAVICLDADGQHDPKDIPKFLAAYETHPEDVIVGSRMHDKGAIPRERYNSMRIARFYVSLCANQYIEDTQCGFRLYPLGMIREMELTTERYVTETEILVKTGDSGRRIRHVTVKTIYGNSVSHFKPVPDAETIIAYLSSYLWIKWFQECVTPNGPFTYKKGNLRDRIARRKGLDKIFQIFTMGSFLPAMLMSYLMYILLQPFLGNTLTSVKRPDLSFYKIFLATELLPVLGLLTATDRLFRKRGVNLLDGFIDKFYPNIWAR